MQLFELLYQRRDFFLGMAAEHLAMCGLAVLFAFSFGLLLGVYISEHPRLARVVLGVTNVIYTIPSISMLGFLMPLFGIGDTTAIIALSLYGLMPMIRNTHAGLQNIDAEVVEAAKGMGSTPMQLLLRVKLPLALPVVLSGLKTMVVMVIALGGIASFIGAGGLGVAIYRGITTNNATMTLAGSLLIALIALVMDGLFSLIEKQIPWKKRRTT